MNEDSTYYSIGEVSRICNISKKALRHYDKIGLISADAVGLDNNYRFYSRKSLLLIPVIKYYKQMGFRLEEMKGCINGKNYTTLEKIFREKMSELNQLQIQIQIQCSSVKDWHDLIVEAQHVVENNTTEVSVKFLELGQYCSKEIPVFQNYAESIINIEWTNFIEEIQNEITGPVMIVFPDFDKKLEKGAKGIRIMQQTLMECSKEHCIEIGGYMVASCYHIGSHSNIHETYEKIVSWAKMHGYFCGRASIERYVTDYWTNYDENKFVTQIMVKIYRRKDECLTMDFL